MEKPLQTLHKALLANKYDVPENYDDFEYTLSLPGNEGYQNRHQLWKSLKENNFDVPDNYEDFSGTLFQPKKPQQKNGLIAGTVNAHDGMTFTAAGLDSLEKGATPVVTEPQAPINSQPIDLSRPQEPQLSASLLHPFMQGATEREEMQHSPQLNRYWANAQQEASRRAMDAKPTADDFEYRMKGWEAAAEADAIRKANRGEFDKEHMDELYRSHVIPIAKEEIEAGEQRAREGVNKMLEQPKVPGNPAMATSNFQDAFNTAVISERETDPAKIADATIKRVQQDDAFGDYVLRRMGISDQGNGQGESEQLTEREKKYMQMLFSRETSEVADQLIQKMYDQYKEQGAPKSALDYIAGKAFHENFVASLFNAMVRRAANSSGIREQLRAMASEEYGDNAGWLTRMAGGAAPFAVDIATGGFFVPGIVGGAASQLAMRGGAKLLSKAVTRELSKRAAAKGLEDAALREAAAGGADIAQRYLATNSPILNVVVRSIGSAANFSAFKTQSELVRQLSEGEFSAGNLFKQAIHGAELGGVMGVAGGLIANVTQRSGLAGKIAGDIAGFGTEAGIFAAFNGIERAREDGVNIMDVDWADITGQSLLMVAGMKAGAHLIHGTESIASKGIKQSVKDLAERYRKSKDYGMQLNQRDIEELQQAGYDFTNIFGGLGELGKVAPVIKNITRDAEGTNGNPADSKSPYIDIEAYNRLMQDQNIASSTKRKIAYMATGNVLTLEPVFGVTMNIDENGKATVTTTNIFGRTIETKDYNDAEEARQEFEVQNAAKRINVVNGLENMIEKANFAGATEEAKRQTLEETGVDVDDVLMGKVEDKEQAALTLDTYIRNLSDTYNNMLNKRIGGDTPASDATGTVADGGTDSEMSQRTERRQAAYDRGATVADDETQLSAINYDCKLAEARMLQQMPDGSQTEAIRKQIMDAIVSDDVESAEHIFQQHLPYFNEQQREAIDAYIDSYETGNGITDAIRQQIEDYEQEVRQVISQRSDEMGIITQLQLKDGSTVYYLSGDLGGYHSSVTVITEDGETKQISTKDILQEGAPMSAEETIDNTVEAFSQQLGQRYEGLSDGSMLLQGQEADIVYANQLFHVTSLGQDEAGNNIVQMEDGSQMALTPEQTAEAVDAADMLKIQQLMQDEQQAMADQQRTERFNAGIVGYAEGTPRLDAQNTDPAVGAEYLLAQTDADGNPIDRKVVLSDIQTKSDQLSSAKQQVLQALQTAQNNLAMAEDGSEEAQQADAVIKQLEPQLAELDAQRRKWGEIRQAMMTDEERQAFEKDRIKAINNAKVQSKREAASAEQQSPVTVSTTAKELTEKYPERRDGEAFVEDQRKQLSQQYRNDVYPAWDNIQKELDEYQHGLTDLTPDKVKMLTDEQARLDILMSSMVEQQNAWKKLGSDLAKEYAKMERQQLMPHELAMQRLQNETDKAKKIKLAQEAFKDDPVALAVLDNLEPQDINEFVAANLGAGSINWEGLERGEHHVRGLQEEMGKNKTRGVGAQYDTNPYNYFLAPTGQGKGIDEVVHNMSEGSPYDPQDVKNALISMLAEATKPTDISHYIENSRIAQAEQIYEENLQRERDAELEAEDEAIREMTGMEPEEYDAYMGDLEQRLAEQAGYRTSDEYFNNIVEYEQARKERSIGGGQETGTLGMSQQEGDEAGASQKGQGGAGEADGQLAQVTADIDTKLAQLREKYPDRTFIIHYPDADAKGIHAEHSGTWELRGADAELVSSLMGPFVEMTDGVIKVDSSDALQEILTTLVKNGHKAGVFELPADDTTKGEDLMHVPFVDRLQVAKGETNVNPTEEQKKAGNYKMGHIRFGGYRMSIENPKGSTRSGVDRNGRPWSIEMKDTYGYIGQKYGADGDHLDFFINDDADLDKWNGRVYVVDQKNEDGTFDEHKVMYGYPNFAAAKQAYMRNYEDGWWDKHVMQMTGVKKETFDKWLEDSDHKRKPFADYSRTRSSATVTNNVDQLMADIDERTAKPATEEVVVNPLFKDDELAGKTVDELRQLRKKANADRSMAKVLLGITDAIKGTDKERKLQDNIMRAEVNIEAIDKAIAQKEADTKRRIEQQEIGGAMVDQLENMGFDVTTDRAEMRRVRKQAEADKSKEGKLRHFETRDGKIYGFVYKGKMYLDPTKIDGELPLHEYAHPWCEAFRRLNPEGWKNIVSLMKADKDTWEFIKSLNSDLKSEDDIAEEMITKCSGQRGAEYAKAEYERMNAKDPDYKSKWGNIWKNISKIIQDFWKQVGDFLHIKYESAEQVYDQVIRDFANKVNPRKRVEQWLKERDNAYMSAVSKGDNEQAAAIFDEALRENIGNGIVPFVSAGGYRGKLQKLAHGVKSRDPKVIAEVADMMAPLIPKDAVLVPAPSHTGKATDMLDLAQAISERTGAPVADVLTSGERSSQYEAKYAGKPIASSEMGIVAATDQLPADQLPVVIDNVVDTGNTAEACVRALGKGIVASLADSADRYKHVAALKSAEPIVTDRNGNVVPLSKRFEITGKYLEKPAAPVEETTGIVSEPVSVDSVLNEVERRREVAEEKKAEDAVKTFLSKKPKGNDEAVRQRATKAVLKTLEKAGVPFKVVSKEEERQMLKLFSMMNQDAVREFARRPSIRAYSAHSRGRYCVYNMNDPFGVPMYAEKLSVAQLLQKQLKRMAPEGDWAVLDIGYPNEVADSQELRNAADMNVGDLQAMMALHGTGYTFTKFDHSHIGEGAGSQVFGWGTYLTSGEKIAKNYADTVAKRKYKTETPGYDGKEVLYKGEKIDLDQSKLNPLRMAYDTLNSEGTIKKAVAFVERLMDYAEEQDMKDTWQEVLNILKNSKKSDFKVRNADLTDKRFVYKVDIPEDTGDNYLDWMTTIKKPLRKKIADAVRQLDGEPQQSFVFTNYKNGWQSLADMIEREQFAYKEIHDRLLMAFGGRVKDAEKVSKLMNSLGFVGVKYPAGTIWGGGDGATNYVIFNEDDAKITDTIQFMFGDDDSEQQPVFISNALQAVDGIKQEKATAEQWLAMIQKNGGLKAGEDKWLGLSDWLNEHKGEKLTKQDVQDFIRQNQIEVDEVPYQEYFNVDGLPKMQEFRKEFDALVEKYTEEKDAVDKEANDFNDEMYEKYGTGWANDPERLSEKDRERNDDMIERYQKLWNGEVEDLAFSDMVDKYGDDFGAAFEVAYESGQLVPQMDMYDEELSDAAKHFLEFDVQPINSTRLDYTTEGLKNKREIALTVPTIEPYNVDEIHFGDAGGGRAVAWTRFGDTEEYDKAAKEALDAADKELYDYLDRMTEKYNVNPDYPERLEDKLTPEEKAEHERIMANIHEKEAAFDATNKKVLVIDEIQSKRHQEGRDKGYKVDPPANAPEKIAYDNADEEYHNYSSELRKKYGRDDISYGLTEEEKSKLDELFNKRFQARIDYSKYLQAHGYGAFSRSDIPDAPFEKNWHELAMKRMLRYAAENGYDKIAWTTGEQQADRYDIGDKIKDISVSVATDPMTGKPLEGKYEIFPHNHNNSTIMVDGASGVMDKDQILRVYGKDLGQKMIDAADKAGVDGDVLSGDDLHIGAEGMQGFYDEILVRFMNKYGKKWGIKVDKTELPAIGETMWSIDVTPEMKESVLQGQPMFQKEGKRILGWSDGKQVYLTQAGLNPNTPIHECTHLWDKWCMKEHPDLWKKLVNALKKTSMWEEIAGNPNYRNIWSDENRMASEVHSRLSGATGEDEFMKAAFKKNTPQSIINEVKSALRKFWEAVLRLFTKHAKTIADDFESLQSIIRMPIRDLVNQDFEKVMKVAGEDAVSSGDLSLMNGDVLLKTLMGVHNISEEKLKKALKQGGLANPSLAVFDTRNYSHTDYGEISLIPRATLVDSKTGRNAGTYSGDAWTPTYPNVEKFLTKKGEKHLKAIAKEAAGGDAEMERHLIGVINDYVEGNGDRMHFLFLKQKGLNPEVMQERTTHSKEEFDAITKIFGEPMSTMPSDLTEEQRTAMLDLVVSAQEKKIKESAADIKDEEKREKYIKSRVESYRDRITDDNGRLYFAPGDEFVYDNWRDEKRRQNPQPDWYKTDIEANYRVAKEGLSEEYAQWKEQLLHDEDIEEKLFAGWTPDGDKRYVKNTVENASRLMNKEADTNAYGNGGVNASKSVLLKKLKSLSEIRKYRHLLMNDEQVKEWQKETEDEWFSIIQRVSDMQQIDSNRFINIDIAEARLQEAMTMRDPIGYLNKEYGYDIDKDSELASDLMNFMEKAKEAPVKYFETKFKRPVGIEEFAVAIVPTTTSPEVVKALKDAGLEVHTYERSSIGDANDQNRINATMNAVGMRNDILFHIEDDPETVKRLDKEPKEVGYRNVVMNPDGTLGSPMANRLGKKGVGRKATTMFEYGKWERSDEHPELATEDGKIDLIKPGNKEVGGVDYNPYIHIRPNKVNKQFKQAWERPNLIYVETEYPKSELEGNYQAEKAALPVGKHPWGGGELILSRWDKPVRMVPWEEVADDWEKEFAGRGVEFDIVPPALLSILAERGVEILPPHKGMGKACNEAYEAWKATQYDMMRRRSTPVIETVNTKFNKDLESLNDKSVLMLGSPSQVLLSTGIKNKPMKLYGTKLIAKAKKHGYEPADIKNLPSAVASPLAVFTGSHPDSFAILTVLKIKGNNVLVSVSPSNDVNDVDFNIISSVYDKKANSVLRWINEGKGLYYDKEKALTYLRHSTPIVETTDKQELGSAAKIVNSFENPKLSDEKIREIYPEYTEAGDTAAEQLGGVGVVWEQQTLEPGTKGWYNPNDNTVHVAIDEVEDVDDAVRTVYHEKLGHEGLVALLGSQEAVNKFGSFVFNSAGKTIRQRIMEKADEIDPDWKDGARYSKAAQEVLADIAADGPRTADEFDLWTKVKHYLIRLLNKIGAKWKGLLNDKDLAYYIAKTGEALKKWNAMSDAEKQDLSAQATNYDIMRSRGGKPRQKKGESMAQYFQRLREWEKWRVARQTARDNGDPEPEESTFHQQAEADFRADLAEWKERNNISAETAGATTFPRRQDGETPQEYAVRVAEYEADKDLWNTAPKLMDYLRKANEDYRRAYTEWRERYDLQEEISVDQRIYEGDVDPEPTFTDADMEAEALAERDLADGVGMEIDEQGAKRMAKLAVIERRKDFESANAEDAIWVYDFMKQTDAAAKQIAERSGEKVTGKELREALPFLIEADRRKDNLEAEREQAVMEINMSKAIQQAHTFVDYFNLDKIRDELREMNNAWQHREANPDPAAQQAYRNAAARLAKKLNELNAGRPGYNDLFADDIMQIRSLLTNAVIAGRGAVMPESAERFAGMPEVEELMKHIKSWYDEFYQVLEDAGLRGDAGYIEDGYVNHVWDKEKSDPKAWEQYVENRQRTKSPNMRHREIDTYMDGISIGLVPKYTDIADMIAHYSRQNNEAVANRHFLDDMRYVVVQEMNSDGEVTAVLPLLMTEKPEALLRDKYAQYYVPGAGDVYVLKHIQKRFANIFGTMRTQDAAGWLSNIGKAYDLTSSTAKKIQLALSGFHALALFEVDVAQNSPAVALKHLLKYIVTDSFKSHTVPAYAHPEDFKLAAKHLVQLGATEDYAAADVNAITKKMREYFKGLQADDAAWKKATGVVGSPAAIFMDWINQGFDTVLWNYLHDGLKLSAFKELAKQVDRRVEKEGLDEDTREQLLDEAGQYVNDMFGGQYWELLNVSPATLKWMRRFFLSPDWLVSTQRHFFANFGFGSIYSDGGFREYVKYNADNIKRMFGADIAHNELRRLRSKNAKYCYLVGAMIWWGIFYNAINALCRWMDEKDEKAKAEEERKTNPAYKSPYELAYPDGMKWYDYTMYGNAVGQQTHLFTGRYSDGTETYVRWGKQFREFPELFMGRHGAEFPAPMIQRMMSKANPNIGTMIDFLGAQNIGGFDGSYENKELREKYGKTVATLAAMSRHFIPFGMPTQTDKEYKLLDFFMPSSKGFSRYKAKDYFETFIMDGNWAGIEATYNACVMNGIDAQAGLEAAIASIKATHRRELTDNVSDLSSAVQQFDAATKPEERALLANRIKKYLKDSEYKVMTREEALEKVHNFIDGTDVSEKENQRYIMLATSEDIIAEEKLRDLGRTAKKFKDEVEAVKGTDQYATMRQHYSSWFTIKKKVDKATRAINKEKKRLGALNEDEIMEKIRETIRRTQSEIEEIQAPN